MSQAPAGWYPQPNGRQRYWDGQRWTEHFAPVRDTATQLSSSVQDAGWEDPTVANPSDPADAPRRRPIAGVMKATAAGVAGLLIGLAAPDGTTSPATLAEVPQTTATATATATATITTPGPTVTTTVTPEPEPAPTVTETVTVTEDAAAPVPFVDPGAGAVYYDNCTAARRAGVTPLRRGDPGYGRHLDRDGDGVACE